MKKHVQPFPTINSPLHSLMDSLKDTHQVFSSITNAFLSLSITCLTRLAAKNWWNVSWRWTCIVRNIAFLSHETVINHRRSSNGVILQMSRLCRVKGFIIENRRSTNSHEFIHLFVYFRSKSCQVIYLQFSILLWLHIYLLLTTLCIRMFII